MMKNKKIVYSIRFYVTNAAGLSSFLKARLGMKTPKLDLHFSFRSMTKKDFIADSSPRFAGLTAEEQVCAAIDCR